MTRKARRCHECGIGKVKPLRVKGRYARYKTMPRLEIPKNVAIPTCDNCGAEWMDEEAAQALDKALDKAFRAELRSRAEKAIEALSKHVSQRRLEKLLGLSQGYLSKLRSGDRDPSAELVSQLAMLSKDPRRRIHELEAFWDDG